MGWVKFILGYNAFVVLIQVMIYHKNDIDIIFTILIILVLTFSLKVVIGQSNNFIFIIAKKPWLWIILMGLLPMLYFFIGSKFDNSFNVIWWSALLAFISSIPPKIDADAVVNQKEMHDLVDIMYKEMGILRGRLKYRLGLTAYLIGAIVGWILFYGEIVSV